MKLQAQTFLLTIFLILYSVYTQQYISGVSVDQSIIYQNNCGGSEEGGSRVYITGSKFSGKHDLFKVAFIYNGRYVTPSNSYIIYIYIYI